MEILARRITRLGESFLAKRFSKNVKEKWDDVLRDRHETSLGRFTESHRDVVNAILKNTEITRDHLTPELKLFLLTENCPLYHEPFVNEKGRYDSLTRNVFHDPFWSIYWPGGQALTRFILDEKENILGCITQDAGKDTLKILDLGAGCGATAIAARSIGPWKVIANDINEVACTAIAMNAILNNVDIEISWRNLLEKPPDRYDVILVGDLLYDEKIANILIAWLDDAYIQGARIYLGDPGRHGLTKDLRKRLRLLCRYPLPENVKKQNHGYDTATVWEFGPDLK